MESGLVTVEKQQGIAYVTLSRPEKYNALNFEMFKALDRVIKSLAKDKQVQLVILSGAGGNFSSGLDVKSLASNPSKAINLLFKWLPGDANLAQRVSLGWQRLPMPVIAVIEGVCYGGGMQIVLGADLRLASQDAKLSIMEAKWGLVPDMAGLAGLRQLISKDQALKLTLTAEVITADEALSLGLVTEVHDDPMARAKELAAQILQTSPDACAAIKQSINRSWTASLRSLLSRESLSQVRLLLGKNRLIAAARQTKEPQKPYGSRQSWW